MLSVAIRPPQLLFKTDAVVGNSFHARRHAAGADRAQADWPVAWRHRRDGGNAQRSLVLIALPKSFYVSDEHAR